MKTDTFKFIGLVFIFCALLISCETTVEDRPTVSEDELPEDKSDLSTYAKRHIEAQLQIPATEKYTLTIIKENLDGDDKKDAVILVNRYEFAINEASKSNNPAKNAALGFMGSYNYMFYFDGGLNMISPAINIPSSPILPLEVSFAYISSTLYKDILIDFRIRNASYKDFFTVINHTPRRIFQWKNFDGLGTQETEAYTFKFENSEYAPQKDILVYKAKIQAIAPGKDVNVITPKLDITNELAYRFFYLAQEGKYVTKK